MDAVGLEAAGHLAGGAGDDLRAPRDVAGRCRTRRQLVEHGLAGGRARADEEAMVAVEKLGQGEVEAVGRSGPAVHRGAEAEIRGVAAVDGDDEHVGASRGIVGVLEAAAEEHAVLDRDRRHLARLHAEKRRRLRRSRLLLDRESTVAAARLPEADARRQQLALPGVRPDRVAEDGVVVAPREPVGTGGLLVRPACREVGGPGDLVEDDRAVTWGRADDAIAASAERLEQRTEIGGGQHHGLGCSLLRHVLPSPARFGRGTRGSIGRATDRRAGFPRGKAGSVRCGCAQGL